VKRGLGHRFTGQLGVETRGLAKDTLLLGVGKVATTAGMVTQVALITHVLGLRAYGVFSLTVAFVALVGRFFDVGVGTTAIAFGARYLDRDQRRRAGIYQLSYVVDFALGVGGFAVAAIAAPWAGRWLVGDEGFVLFFLYALTLLASTVDTTSVAVLQQLDRYRTITSLVVFRELTRAGAVVVAVFAFGSLTAVMALLVVQDALTGALGVRLAARAFRRQTGLPLFRPALSTVRGIRREMFAMIFQTNLIAYGRLAQAQAPALVLGLVRGPLEVGIFKVGMAGAAAFGQLSTPAWNAVMPRLSRLWADRRVEAVRQLVVQGSVVALAVMGLAGALTIALREPILELVGGDKATAATLVFTLGVLGQIVNGVFFWNDSLLFASGRAHLVTKVFLPSVTMLLILAVPLGQTWGANGVAASVFAFGIVTNVGLTIAASQVIRSAEESEETPSRHARRPRHDRQLKEAGAGTGRDVPRE
jgi:O-antigen/teichoic acid export membrane protein